MYESSCLKKPNERLKISKIIEQCNNLELVESGFIDKYLGSDVKNNYIFVIVKHPAKGSESG